MNQDTLIRVHDATDALLRSVDAMTAEQIAEPSLLPGWSRAHVVAHLALNALGFARAIEGARHQQSVPAYDSDEVRTSDIEESATTMDVDSLREFLFHASGKWNDATRDVSDWDETFERTPGGPTLTIGAAVKARWREVEIHHVDLDTGYRPAGWSAEFTDFVFANVVESRLTQVDATLETAGRQIVLGSGGPTISGAPRDLAWWLLGRGSGEGLIGDLPTLGSWR